MRARRISVLFAVGVSAMLAVSGCTSSSSGPATASAAASPGGASNRISVVASTNVWGDIASQVGGGLVSVTSIIDDPSKDPHEYQADARNQLALSKAQVVIENGGGYDDFVDTMLNSANNPGVKVLNAANISGIDQHPVDESFNEHVWYDLPTVSKVVDQLASTFSSVDTAGVSTFQANAAAFKTKLESIQNAETAAKPDLTGKGAAITEPVPLYMLTAMGLANKTPKAFSEAIQNGTDVAPDIFAQTLTLFSSGQIAVLAYNSQTSGPQTEAVLTAAQTNGVAIVPVTETLPAGTDFIAWMTSNVTAITAAAASK